MMYYSQRDSKWANKLLGTSRTAAIWQHGSLLVSMANLLTAFGHNRTPDELNDVLKQREWFDEDEITNRRAPADLFPQDIQVTKEWRWRENEEVPLYQMADAGDPNVWYIVTINHGPGVGQTAYSVLITNFVASLKGMDLMVVDPIDGSIKPLSTYGDLKSIVRTIYRFKRIQPIASGVQDPRVLVTMDDIDILTLALFGNDPTDDDYALEGNSWRHVVLTFLQDPRFHRSEPMTHDEAVSILKSVNQQDPTEDQIQNFLAECPDHRTAITDKLLPSLDEARQPRVEDNRPLGDQITELVNRNR